MLKDLFQKQKRNLNIFFDQIDLQTAEAIFQELLTCKGMLIFTGIGKSGIVAEKLATTMISTGTKALFLPPMNALHGDIGMVSKEDILIFISKSGESEELLNLLPFIRKKNVKTMAWVSSPNSKLLDQCDLGICLPLEQELCPFDLAPTTSAAIQMIFGDVLSVALMQAKNFSLDDYALNHPAGSIGKKITLKVSDIMLGGKDLPICYLEDPLKEVLVELSKKKCGCLLVLNQQKVMQGIFTDGDLRRALQKGCLTILNEKIKDLMTTSFLSVQKNSLAWEALSQMQKDPKRYVMAMPVMEDQKLVGLVRMHDIVQAGIH